jgi:hypothetical protein
VMTSQPENIVSFLEDGTACVVLFPYAPELTERERERIDEANAVRFFVYGCSDAPAPAGHSGQGKPQDYPMKSLGWAIDRSTYIASEVLDGRQPRDTPQALIKALMDLAAGACSDDHRCAVLLATDRRFRRRLLWRNCVDAPDHRSPISAPLSGLPRDTFRTCFDAVRGAKARRSKIETESHPWPKPGKGAAPPDSGATTGHAVARSATKAA